jgi:hypothetical protein
VIGATVVFKSVVISGTRLVLAAVVTVAADVEVASIMGKNAVVPLATNCISDVAVAIVSCEIMILLVSTSWLVGAVDVAASFSNAIVGIFSEIN